MQETAFELCFIEVSDHFILRNITILRDPFVLYCKTYTDRIRETEYRRVDRKNKGKKGPKTRQKEGRVGGQVSGHDRQLALEGVSWQLWYCWERDEHGGEERARVKELMGCLALFSLSAANGLATQGQTAGENTQTHANAHTLTNTHTPAVSTLVMSPR